MLLDVPNWKFTFCGICILPGTLNLTSCKLVRNNPPVFPYILLVVSPNVRSILDGILTYTAAFKLILLLNVFNFIYIIAF